MIGRLVNSEYVLWAVYLFLCGCFGFVVGYCR